MMSIRARLVLVCLILALLPAVPLSILVGDLIERSFDVGLSGQVSRALESGIEISRAHLAALREDFVRDASALAGPDREMGPSGLSRGEGIVEASAARPDGGSSALSPFLGAGAIDSLLAGRVPVEREAPAAVTGIRLFETADRAVMMAVISPSHGRPARLFYRSTDPAFLGNAESLVDAAQGFAGLRALEGGLRRSFLVSFLVIYAVVAALTFFAALALAERISSPLGSISEAASRVAGGDWSARAQVSAGGEIGRLASGFNEMVERLGEQSRRLVDLEKMASWREIARRLAHEIKNPLLPIRLTVEEMRDQYRGGDDEYRSHLEESARVVEEELEHLQRLVREFSSFARMPALAPRPGSIEALARDVAGLHKRADIQVYADPALPPFPFDPDQMRRAFTNLFENAADAAPGGKASVEVTIGRDGGSAVITVTDDGPGIPEEDLGRVFDPYFTGRPEGTGLGLAVTKSIVLLHGGSIDVMNRRGAVFTMTLPLEGPREDLQGEE